MKQILTLSSNPKGTSVLDLVRSIRAFWQYVPPPEDYSYVLSALEAAA